MTTGAQNYQNSIGTRMLYSLMRFGVATPAEAIAGVIAFYIMSGFLITLSGLLVSSVFGLIMPAFGYDTLLEVQPASVDLGFRIFLTIPTSLGFLLAIFLLWLYPLHGKRLQNIKEVLEKKKEAYAV